MRTCTAVKGDGTVCGKPEKRTGRFNTPLCGVHARTLMDTWDPAEYKAEIEDAWDGLQETFETPDRSAAARQTETMAALLRAEHPWLPGGVFNSDPTLALRLADLIETHAEFLQGKSDG